MESKRQLIYLAALLHDIGKFYQRADKNLLKDYHNDHLEKMKSLICPEKESRFGYHHAWWTYKFFYDNKDLFNSVKEGEAQIYKVAVNENTEQDNLINIAIYHHQPHSNSDLQRLVQLADWWSSGMERTRGNMEQEEGTEYGKFRYKKVMLKNLLSLINSGNGKSKFPLKSLDISERCFPINKSIKDLSSIGNEQASEPYYKLWEDFSTQLKSLPTDSAKGFVESLLALLHKFTWCIPASTNDLSHVSLYEHLKTTAAIALSLYDFKINTGCTFDAIKNDEETFPLILSCWDISGIQKFIYNISGTKASVSLKGRSFYLQLLMETIKQKVLDHADIKGCFGQVVYSSGGKMFVVLPNTQKCKDALVALHGEFEQIIWDEHQDSLYINHGFIEFRCDTKRKGGVIIKNDGFFKEGTIADLWEKVIDAAAANKYKKYNHLIQKKKLLSPSGQWGNGYDLCAVTGQEGRIGEELSTLKNGLVVSRTVREQIELGEALKDTDYIITFLNDDVNGNSYLKNRINSKKEKHLTIAGSGIHHYLFDQKELADNRAEFRNITSADVSRVKRVNNTDFNAITSLKGKKSVYAYQFYGGNEQAVLFEKGRKSNKTFEQLCWIDDISAQLTYLGVLRMDVDNLGKIFKEGLAEDLRSFAAYSTLSAQLDWFFSGYLNTIRNSPEFKDFVNIIYSGGDDVFAVGRWDKMILFAEKIREKFREYCGGREDISISGGVVIAGEKFPIRMAAKEAGNAEDKSKDFKQWGSDHVTKNAFTFFGQTVSWENEFKEVQKVKENLVRLCDKDYKSKPLSKAILHQLMLWKTLKDEFENNKGSLSFKWHTAYYLKRYLDRYKGENDQEIRNYLKEIQIALMSGQLIHNKENYGTRSYDIMALAARWAEMELKELLLTK